MPRNERPAAALRGLKWSQSRQNHFFLPGLVPPTGDLYSQRLARTPAHTLSPPSKYGDASSSARDHGCALFENRELIRCSASATPVSTKRNSGSSERTAFIARSKLRQHSFVLIASVAGVKARTCSANKTSKTIS